MLPEVVTADGCCLCERSFRLSNVEQPHSPMLADLVENVALKFRAKTDDSAFC